MRYPYELNLVGDAQDHAAGADPAARAQGRPQRGARRSRPTSRDWWQIVERRALTDADPVNPMRIFYELSAAAAGRTRSSPPTRAAPRTGTRGTCASAATCAARCPARSPRWVPASRTSIGAKWAHPDRPAIALVGDGAMQMNGMAELITIGALLAAVAGPAADRRRPAQQRPQPGHLGDAGDGGRARSSPSRRRCPTSTTPRSPAASACCGDQRRRPRTRSARRGTQALAADRPTVLDVRCDPNVPPIPPHATFEQVKAMAGAVLARRRGHAGASSSKGSSRRCSSTCPGGKTVMTRRRTTAAHGAPRPPAPWQPDVATRCERDLSSAGRRRGALRRRHPRARTPRTGRTSGRCRSAS